MTSIAIAIATKVKSFTKLVYFSIPHHIIPYTINGLLAIDMSRKIILLMVHAHWYTVMLCTDLVAEKRGASFLCLQDRYHPVQAIEVANRCVGSVTTPTLLGLQLCCCPTPTITVSCWYAVLALDTQRPTHQIKYHCKLFIVENFVVYGKTISQNNA